MERFLSLLFILITNISLITLVSSEHIDHASPISTNTLPLPIDTAKNTNDVITMANPFDTTSIKPVKIKRISVQKVTPPNEKKKIEVSPKKLTIVSPPTPMAIPLSTNDLPTDEPTTLTEAEIALKFDALPKQLIVKNVLNSPQTVINHKKTLLYKSIMKLPEDHKQALQYIMLEENTNETRGVGGQNIVMLHMGNISDEELVSVWIHELGHVVDTGLLQGTSRAPASAFTDGDTVVQQDDVSTSFYSISWKNNIHKTTGTSNLDFVSGYAMSDPFEDFAETYLFYVLHGNSFRVMKKESTKLTQKYEFMKHIVFQEKEFDTGSSQLKKFVRQYDTTLSSYDLVTFLEGVS